jgi:holo-[acyl-carrier protein] synthase
MVVGIGVDIVDIERIRAALENPKTGRRFRDRVFTEGEIAYCDRRRRAYESFAARFAAKEATIKALGQSAGWQEIEVSRGTDGPPQVHLHGRARQRADELGIRRVLLSLSHSDKLAIAYVIAET